MTAEDDPYAGAACIDAPTDIFFPIDPGGRAGTEQRDVYAAARVLCARCPVRERCLSDHMTERHGMWGGTTPEDRAAMGWIRIHRRRKMRRPSHTSIRRWVLRQRGADLSVKTIVAGTGYSSSSVREVLRLLEAEGVVERLNATTWRVLSGVAS